MKRFLISVIVIMGVFSLPLMAQVEPPADWLEVVEGFSNWFGIFAGLVALTTFVAGFFNGLFKMTKPFARQAVAWIVGVVLALVGNFINLGFLAEATWLMTVLYGFGAGLAANGTFDTPLVQAVILAIEQALGNKKEETG